MIALRQFNQSVCLLPTKSFHVNALPVRAPIAAFLVFVPFHLSTATFLSTFLIQSNTDSSSASENFSPSPTEFLIIGALLARVSCVVIGLEPVETPYDPDAKLIVDPWRYPQ